MAQEKECPYTVDRGHVKTDKYLLTNVEWHPSNWFGDIGQPETGVRFVMEDGKTYDDFQLVQHGWWDFEVANAVILRALDKGWDTTRIDEFMNNLRQRRRFKTTPTRSRP